MIGRGNREIDGVRLPIITPKNANRNKITESLDIPSLPRDPRYTITPPCDLYNPF